MRASFNVKLHSLNLWQREFEMDDRSCATYTRPTEFTSQMRLSITNWSQQNAKTWTYRFIDENNFEQTFRTNGGVRCLRKVIAHLLLSKPTFYIEANISMDCLILRSPPTADLPKYVRLNQKAFGPAFQLRIRDCYN